MKITKKYIDETASMNVDFNNLKKELENRKNEIKSYCSDNNCANMSGTRFSAIISERDKITFNQEKALKVVLKAKAKWLLKQVVDEEKLEEAIRSGEIDGSLFKDCYENHPSKVITFKANK